jgi:hypothetical protein
MQAAGQETGLPDKLAGEKYGVWNRKKNAAGKQIRQMRLRVYPKAAPVPAFRHRLIPAAKDRVDGNAALFYLKAMGFFEQSNAKEQLTKLQRKWRDEFNDEQRDDGNYPPYTWLDAAPESLPKEKVKQYLDLLSFQPSFLYDAARRTRFEHDRALEREKNPIGYLLPSIQSHRELARVQTVRCRFAISEGRIDDAIEIVGQMMALGRHLGNDEFFVSCLVGAAVHGIGVDTGLVLSQQSETPNLYWALAACRAPAIDLSKALARERDMLYLQLPILKEVTEEVRPVEFWVDFTKGFMTARNELAITIEQIFMDGKIPPWNHFDAVTQIAKDYPDAREFLNQVVGLSDKKLDKYSKAQVVFLAVVKYYELAQDDALKHFVVPFSSLPKVDIPTPLEQWGTRFEVNDRTSYLAIGQLLIPATRQVVRATARTDQRKNLWQTVEALRMTAAENGDEFPQTLEKLVVPAPLDPATNRPFVYEFAGGVATIRAARISGVELEIKLEIANRTDNQEQSK